jgi:fructokinase
VIVVVGEALVDLVVAPDGQVTAALGGAPFNTSRACARLDAPTEFVGALSTDRFGRLLAERLATDGVSLEHAMGVEEPTTLAVAELDEGGAASYRFYIESTSVLALPRSVDLTGARALFTGGLGLALPPIAAIIEQHVADAPPECLTMVDVNCRPAVIADRADYLARLGRVLAGADVVKVSDDDLAYLAPEHSPADALAEMLVNGTQVVLLTSGAGGVEVFTRDGGFSVPVDPVAVVDTIGAGDSFDGGFLAWWIGSGRGPDELSVTDDLRRAVVAANAVAGLACTRRGADPPRRADLPLDWAG